MISIRAGYARLSYLLEIPPDEADHGAFYENFCAPVQKGGRKPTVPTMLVGERPRR